MENIENVEKQENVENQETQTKPKKKFDWKKFVKVANRILIALAIIIFIARLPVACLESEMRKYNNVDVDDFEIVVEAKYSSSSNEVRVTFSIENNSGCDVLGMTVDIEVYVYDEFIGTYTDVYFNFSYLGSGDQTTKEIWFRSYKSNFHNASVEDLSFNFTNAEFDFANY